MSGMGKMLVALMTIICVSAAVHHEKPGAYVGQWERKVSNTVTTLTLGADNRLHLSVCIKGRRFGVEPVFELHADYHVTPCGVAYGVVSSLENNAKEVGGWPFWEDEENLIDRPFSFRYRVEEGTLAVHAFHGLAKDEKDSNKELVGRYSNKHSQRFADPAP